MYKRRAPALPRVAKIGSRQETRTHRKERQHALTKRKNNYLCLVLLLLVTSSTSRRYLLLENEGYQDEEALHAITRRSHPDFFLTGSNNSVSDNSSSPLHQTIDSFPTIVVQMKGELGNHLSSIAHGRGLQLFALEFLGLETNMLLRHQVKSDGISSNPKWEPSSKILHQCFNMSDWDFSRGSRWKEYNVRQKEQENWLSFLETKIINLVNGRRMNGLVYKDNQPITESDIKMGLDAFQKALLRNDRPVVELSSRLSLPFLLSDSLDNNLLIDRYFDHFRGFFKLNYSSSSCCGEIEPFEDESVFHFRNFQTEMPRHRGTLQEVTPNQTAFVLFRHLKPGDKVAITTRFHNNLVQKHVDALKARGIQVRIIEGQSGIQDFCFLAKAQKELVGTFQSTFVFWAALLGNARSSILYTLDSPELRRRFGTTIKDRFQYQWRNEELQRIVLRLVQVDPAG